MRANDVCKNAKREGRDVVMTRSNGEYTKALFGGFTLIELLVVISIIALLLSILMPSLGAAKDLAKATICSANLRQIGIGLQMYTGDNDDYIMPWVDNNYSANDGYPRRYWHTRLSGNGYIKTYDVFFCPTLRPSTYEGYRDIKTSITGTAYDESDPAKSAWNTVAWIYGMREFLDPKLPPGSIASANSSLLPKKVISLPGPSEFFVVTDGIYLESLTNYHGYGKDIGSYVVRLISSFTSGSYNRRVDLRHRGKANTVFADGHSGPVERDYFEGLSDTATLSGGGYPIWPNEN